MTLDARCAATSALLLACALGCTSAATPDAADLQASGESFASAGSRPNILVIVADDLGVGDVGVYGGPIARTPNIDTLAAESVMMTDGHVTAQVCSPSRAGLMSGRYQQRFGFEHNPVGQRGFQPIPLTETTLADRLEADGYDTGMVGKWHLGWTPDLRPDKRGFNSYFGIASGSMYFPPGWPGVETVAAFSTSDGNGAAGPLLATRNGEAVEVKKPMTEAFTDAAIDFIRAPRENPFFLYLAYTTPHTPLQTEAKHLAPFPASLPYEQRVLAAMVSDLDDSIGRIRQALRDAKVDANTLVILVSDNGCPLYLRGACFNTGLSGGKRHLLEGGHRIPFLIHWPGVLQPKRYNGLVSTLDITPTVMSAVGAPKQQTIDGVDLLPFLKGEASGPTREALFWRATPSVAVRSGNWKLIQAQTEAGARKTFLFDLSASSLEETNLADQHPDVVKRLEALAAQWQQDLPPAAFEGRSETIEIAGERVVQTF